MRAHIADRTPVAPAVIPKLPKAVAVAASFWCSADRPELPPECTFVGTRKLLDDCPTH